MKKISDLSLKIRTATILIIISFTLGSQGCSVKNCQLCADSSTCLSCKNYYCLASPATCSKCSSVIPNCFRCQDCGNCIECSSYFAINTNGQCQACSVTLPRCLTCSSMTVCNTCIQGAYILGTSCCLYSMPNCKSCLASPMRCDTCASNSYCKITPTQCISCSMVLYGCSTCSSCNVCTNCISNLFTINLAQQCQLCSQLMLECERCNSMSICTKCLTPFYGINSTFKCQSCGELLQMCSTCLSSSACISCQTNYYAINSTSQCQLCSSLIPNCTQCSSTTVCLKCINGYSVGSDFRCKPCGNTMNNCSTCMSPAVCTSCQPGFSLTGLSSCCFNNMPYCIGCGVNRSECDGCINNQYCAVNTTVCAPCYKNIPFCYKCLNCSYCISCIAGFVLTNWTDCYSCTIYLPNCGQCLDNNTCQACISNMYTLNTTKRCDLCSKFIPNCLTCSSQDVCTECQDYRYALDSVYQCYLCGYFIPKCQTCLNSTKCLACIVTQGLVLTSSGQCQRCPNLMQHCLTCQVENICETCVMYYAPKLTLAGAFCQSCSVLMLGCLKCTISSQCIACKTGQIVDGGCSTVVGCIRVNSAIQTSPCTACDPSQFFPLPIDKVCRCRAGKLAGNYCTTIVGCNDAFKNSTHQKCLTCSSISKFTLKNGICECQNYYALNGERCYEICGDGRRFELACDDGNTQNGDGCSSTCKIQYRYFCEDETVFGRSRCIYNGTIGLSLVCLYKLTIPNTAEIVLEFDPYISNIQKSNMKGLTFSTSADTFIKDLEFKLQKLHLIIDYSQSIQGYSGVINLVYDRKYIRSQNSTVTFIIKDCNGDRFKYDYIQTEAIAIIQKIGRILAVSSLFVMIFGSYAYKMIGVETINSIQIIAIILSFAPKQHIARKGFNPLLFSISGFQNQLISSNSTKLPQHLQKINFSTDFLSNTFLVTIFLAISLFLYGMMSLFGKLGQYGKKCVKEQKIVSYKDFIYRFLIFPISMGFYFGSILSVMMRSDRSFSKIKNLEFLQTAATTFTIIVTSLVFFGEWKYITLPKIHMGGNLKHKYYIPLYLTYNFIFCLLFEFIAIDIFLDPLHVLAGFQVFFLILICILRPYKLPIHNFANGFNRFGVLLAFAWIICNQQLIIQPNHQQIIGYLLITYIAIILLLAIVISALLIRNNYTNKQIHEQLKKKIRNSQSLKTKKNFQDHLQPYYPTKDTQQNKNPQNIKEIGILNISIQRKVLHSGNKYTNPYLQPLFNNYGRLIVQEKQRCDIRFPLCENF